MNLNRSLLKITVAIPLALFSALALGQSSGVVAPVGQTPTLVDLICQVASNVNPGDIASAYGIQLTDVTPGGPFVLFGVPPQRVETIEESFGQDTRIVWFELNEGVDAPEVGTESKGAVIPAVGDRNALYKENAGLLAQIHWSQSLVPPLLRRVRVAVLDTGLSPLAGTIWRHVVRQENYVYPSPYAWDTPLSVKSLNDPANAGVGHGTMVAGLIDQLAPNSDFIIEKVADSAGNATTWTVIRGLVDATVNGAQVCNVSLGAPGPLTGLEEVTAWTAAHGLIVIAPSGNDDLPRADEPAALDGVICITGVAPDDTRASFSNWDSNAVAAAPATGVKSIWWTGQIGVWSGTSFSAPLVTGALALSIGRNGPMTGHSAVNALEQSGDSIDALNPGYQGMLGMRLNCQNLVNAVKTDRP